MHFEKHLDSQKNVHNAQSNLKNGVADMVGDIIPSYCDILKKEPFPTFRGSV